MSKSTILIFIILAAWCNSTLAVDDIITVFDDQKSEIFFREVAQIPNIKKGLKEAAEIVNRLKNTIKPRMPASSLAAPQIGISKQVFIYSWDRSCESLEVVINPVVLEEDEHKVNSWEACFSTVRKDGTSEAVLLKRPKKIRVEYTNLSGDRLEYVLEGFAVKVFMHEYDHLRGIESTSKVGANVTDFASIEDLEKFLARVKSKEKVEYCPPEFVGLKYE